MWPLPTGILAVAAIALLCATLGIVIPAPVRILLPWSVGAPELSAWLGLLALLLILLAARGVSHLPLAAAVLGLLLAVVPLVRVPAAVARADASLAAAFGSDFLARLPPDVRAHLRPHAVVPWQLLAGSRTGPARETRGVLFASPDGAQLTLDVYQPLSGGGPVVVQLYGGAWQRGAPGNDPALARYLSSVGYVVFAIDYRHAPQWRWPAQLADVSTALEWVRAHAAEYGGDARRMALLGRSAGAHLALMAAYTAGAPDIAAVISLYGPTDLVRGYQELPRPDPLDVRRTLATLLGGPPSELLERYREASPVTYASRRQPPTLQIIGARDHIVRPLFPRSLDDRLRAAGNVSLLVELPWADHAFDAVPFGPSAQIALYTAERFLAVTLHGR